MCDLFLYNVSCIWQLVWKASSQQYLICMIIPCWIQLTLKLYSAIYSWLFRKLSQSLLSFYMMCEIKDIEHYTLSSVTYPSYRQGRKRNIFQRGQSKFCWFFSRREIWYFPVKLPILVDPKQISGVSKSEKWSSAHFHNFSPFHFQFSTSSLSSLPPFFSGRSAKFPSEKCLWGTLPPCTPRLLRHCIQIQIWYT